MDALSRLPLECLQRILQVISDKQYRKSLETLAALVRVSRYISFVALPFLYHAPFNALYGIRTGKQTRALLRTLLASTPIVDLHPALIFEFKFDAASTTTSPEPHSRLLGYIHNLSMIPHQFKNCMEEGTSKSEMKESNYILERLEHIPSAYSDNFQCKGFLHWYCHYDVVFKELIWALSRPILEQLESLSIPLSDITRYHQVIDRLPRLEHVRFILDLIYDDNAHTNGPTMLMREDEAMQAIVQFVEEHTWVFKGRLKSVIGIHSEAGIYVGKSITMDARRQIYRFLPPLHKPQSISNHNWDQVMAHPSTTDLSHVESIWDMMSEQWRHAHREGIEVLPRCRSLKQLGTVALGKGSFAWAAQEKKRLLNFEPGSVGGSGDHQEPSSLDGDDATSAARQVTLPPLELVRIFGSSSLSDEGDDIAFAFSQTLTRLSLTAIEGPGPLTTFRLGRGWVNLPLLTELELICRHSQIVIDPMLLTLCPNLSRLHAEDGTTEYRCQDIDPYLPAHFPRIRSLKLEGWPALSFHPATLESTAALRVLYLCSSRRFERICFIPPMEELNRSYGLDEGGTEIQSELAPAHVRPRWSWDWHLPQLRALHLKGEFAIRFEFRMLLNCPGLEELVLNIHGADSDHSRVLSHADFFLPPVVAATIDASTTCSSDGQDASAQQHRPLPKPTPIIVRNLWSLHLGGRWVLNENLLTQLIKVMFPKIGTMHLNEPEGLPLRTLVQLLKTCKQLITFDFGLPEPTSEEGAELGLYRRRGLKKDMKHAFPLKLFFSTTEYLKTEYLLLRDPSVLVSCKDKKLR